MHERMPEVLRPRPGPVWLGQEQADPKALKALLVS
jgi:putative SOS response-associated peptidase YedK